MHIPDGYLSPATCTALYATSAPFWYVALQRVQKALHTRLVPLLSLFAAFSFVIMMFNLPLPGGTTGHAVGIGLAAVVLGPWASMLAVSIALIIQALFFGDGGITAIGANCFNMAIVGSLVAYGVYRVVAGGSPIVSFRRVVAAGLAGYAAINVSALFAAVEFGIQPLLYHDATGAPLYCPYPLSIAIPAMMIGHLSIAGFAEAMVSAGVVAFLQKSDPSLLKSTAGSAASAAGVPMRGGLRTLRPLWLGLGLLLMLTPLGILAAGSAWGEWVASDFSNPAVRQQIAASSLHQAAPAQAPAGLERLSSVWTAPFARYAPPLVRSASFGYLLSAMFGAGLVTLACLLAGRFLRGPGYGGPEERPA
jgi:cobalt/nickel transport system permease protein